VLVDNVEWNKGKHTITMGGQIAWLQYNFTPNSTGVNPLQLSFSNSATGGYNAGTTTLNPNTGQGYASFLVGAVTGGTNFTLSSVPETGGRFRPISPYIQDNWKVTSRLTLDIGLRWDY
jgi:outer membrane receptor protein involved in Fe transport